MPHQYEVKASYHTDNLEFFQGLVEEQQRFLETDYGKASKYSICLSISGA